MHCTYKMYGLWWKWLNLRCWFLQRRILAECAIRNFCDSVWNVNRHLLRALNKCIFAKEVTISGFELSLIPTQFESKIADGYNATPHQDRIKAILKPSPRNIPSAVSTVLRAVSSLVIVLKVQSKCPSGLSSSSSSQLQEGWVVVCHWVTVWKSE